MTSWTVAHQAPLSMGFPRQEFWNGLTFPSPGDLPNPGVELESHVSCIDRKILYNCAIWEALPIGDCSLPSQHSHQLHQ